MKILMIGNKESGKTTYMASAFGLLVDGVSGFYTETDDATKQWFQKLFEEIKAGGYPDVTDKRGSYHFELYYNQKKVLKFDWIDYNGGIITDTSIDNLEKDITDSEGMMIFLEAEALWQNKMFAHRFRRIIALLTEHLESGSRPLFSVIVVLTKYDKIPNNVSLDEVIKPIREFLDTAQSNKRLYTRVVPVSCTGKGFYNVELPLLDILDSGMKIEYLTAVLEANSYVEAAKKCASKIGFIDWIGSRLTGNKTYGDLAGEYGVKAQEKINFYESIELPTQNLASYVSNYKITIPHLEETIDNQTLKTKEQQGFIEL